MKFKLKKNIISFAAIITSLLVGEMIFSNVLPLYPVRFLQFFIILSFTGIGIYNQGIKPSVRFFPYMLSSFVFLIPSILFLSSELIVSEVFTLFWWSIFILLISGIISDREGFFLYKRIVFKYTFIIGLLGGMLGLYKLYLFSIGSPPQWALRTIDNWGDDVFIVGSSMNYDYNVFSFGLFMTLLVGVKFYRESTKTQYKIFFAVSNLLILFTAMTSSSRRALLIGSVILFYMLFSIFLPKISNKSLYFSNLFRKNNVPWIFIIAIIIGGIGVTKIDFAEIVQNAEINNLFERLTQISEFGEKENTRTIRWEYSIDYFSKFNFVEKIVGGGFSYLEDMGREFRETDIDHPHNVWISSLLYGGIIGFAITVFTSLFSLFFYIAHYKHLRIFLWWYVLMLSLNFTSSNSIFSSRLFVVLCLLPLLNYKFTRESQ